jgi:transcriptional/translational regulatory protein YebC/TACO1
VTSDDAVEVYTERNDFGQVVQKLTDTGYKPDESKLILKPNTTIALDGEEAMSVLNLIESLEELDDVSSVYHNLELTDEVVAQFA